jgi:ribosome-associated protein
VPEPIVVSAEVVVPAGAVSVRAVRSSGPGGQNVNKVASRVELRIDLSGIEGLSAAARERLLGLAGGRRAADGRLLVTSQRTRDQSRNLADARDKVRRLVAAALVEPSERRPTRPTKGSREARRRAKVQTARRKRARARVRGEDD